MYIYIYTGRKLTQITSPGIEAAALTINPTPQTQAKELFEEAAALGYVPGMVNLGQCYMHGNGTPKDHAKAQKMSSPLPAARVFRSRTMAQNLCACLRCVGENLGMEVRESVSMPVNTETTL